MRTVVPTCYNKAPGRRPLSPTSADGDVCPVTQGQAVDTVDMEMVHISGRTEWDGARLHQAPQNDMRLKTCELFTSGSFHLIIVDRGRPPMPEATGPETEAMWGQLSTMAPEPRLES